MVLVSSIIIIYIYIIYIFVAPCQHLVVVLVLERQRIILFISNKCFIIKIMSMRMRNIIIL